MVNSGLPIYNPGGPLKILAYRRQGRAKKARARGAEDL